MTEVWIAVKEELLLKVLKSKSSRLMGFWTKDAKNCILFIVGPNDLLDDICSIGIPFFFEGKIPVRLTKDIPQTSWGMKEIYEKVF